MGLLEREDLLGFFIDEEPLVRPEAIPEELWNSVADAGLKVHPYLDFQSFTNVAYGLLLTEAPTRSTHEYVKVGTDEFSENIAQYWDLDDAVKKLTQKKHWVFEENPYVEVASQDEYNRLLVASFLARDIEDARRGGAIRRWRINEGKEREIIDKESNWDGRGLYDAREAAPSSIGSIKQYKHDQMEWWGEQTLDGMFQGEEWIESLRELLESQS